MAPRCTRTKAVLDLTPILLSVYIFNEPIGHRGHSLLAALRSNDPTSQVSQFNSISTTRAKPHELPDGARLRGLVYITVSFWVEDSVHPVFSVQVPVPQDWTPRLYLACLNVTIREHQLVICAPKRYEQSTVITLNAVHSMFHWSVLEVTNQVKNQNAFMYVFGGKCSLNNM